MTLRRLIPAAVLIAAACHLALAQPRAANLPVERVALGSDFRVMGAHGVWDAVALEHPHLLLLAGGTIDVGDAMDDRVLRSFYAKVGAVAALRQLMADVPVLATWNDGEYGCRGCGSESQIKAQAQSAFLDFLGAPPDATVARTPGVYQTRLFGRRGAMLQVIALDTLFFRDPLQRSATGPDPAGGVVGPYEPTDDPGATVLGPQQWEWLEAELGRPADLRIVLSSMQILASGHGEPCWALFPRERERLLRLLDGAPGGLLLVSGGREHAELSLAEAGAIEGVSRPLLEVTAGPWNTAAPWRNSLNPLRLGSMYAGANYGVIEIGWEVADPTVTVSVRDDAGGTVLRVDRRLSALGPAAGGGE